MVLSAELYGSQQLAELDHSGPLLVLSAACERELNRRLFSRARATFPNEQRPDGRPIIDEHATLGGAIESLHRGRRLAVAWEKNEPNPEQRVLGNVADPHHARAALLTGKFLVAEGTDLNPLKDLVKRLRKLNTSYRRLAAHDEVVEAATWAGGRGHVLGHEGLLSRIVKALATE